ncbi:MAG: 2-amino-4-hydroxy-6-hydroxymethyldihydropteridine diphosphokinase [bacterium]
MLEIVYLSLGSNIDNRELYLKKALASISAYPDTELINISPVYETEPVGITDEGTVKEFLNMCCALKASLDPFYLLELIQRTERALGRRKTKNNTMKMYPGRSYHSRVIDIDILMFGDRIIYTKDLIVPHPALHERRFVLEPLCDIAASAIHPLLQLTIKTLKLTHKDEYTVTRFKPEIKFEKKSN